MLQRQEYKLKNSSFLPMKICPKQEGKAVQKSCVLVDKTKMIENSKAEKRWLLNW